MCTVAGEYFFNSPIIVFACVYDVGEIEQNLIKEPFWYKS